MQYFLPNRKTLSAMYQATNVELPMGGEPKHLSFKWDSLATMDTQELTLPIDGDYIAWGFTSRFSIAGSTNASAGVFIQIIHIHNGQPRSLFDKPRPIDSVSGSGQLPFLLKPTYPLFAGDSLQVIVISIDQVNAQQVEFSVFCNQIPGSLNPYQRQVLDSKRKSLDNISATYRDVQGDQAPSSASPLVLGPTLTVYPAPGAAAVQIFSYQVPAGQRARIFEHALQHVGGNPPEQSGSGVIWRFKVNGWPLKGLGAQTAQIGAFTTPDRVVIWLKENDLFTVTVEIPNGGGAQAGSCGYRVVGWTAPLLALPTGGKQ
jgi:hypothetical protein